MYLTNIINEIEKIINEKDHEEAVKKLMYMIASSGSDFERTARIEALVRFSVIIYRRLQHAMAELGVKRKESGEGLGGWQ